jgi:hypothetical protein
MPRTKRKLSRPSGTRKTGTCATRFQNFVSMWSAAYQLENHMAYTGRPPDDPSNDGDKPGTAEIKQKLDEVIASGHEQLAVTREMRTMLVSIRRRLKQDSPLILPRRSDELPSAPRRQDPS